MAWVLNNALSTFTFDVDGTTGAKLVSFLRTAGHTWTNADTRLWLATCYDTTTAPSVATVTITPTAATFSTAGVTTDGLGKQLILTWTAVPVGTDAITVTLTIRLNTGEQDLRWALVAAWVGTPTKFALDAIGPSLKVDPFNSPNDQAFCPALDGITVDDPIVGLRYYGGGEPPGFPTTPFAGAALECRMWYPAGHEWAMGYWSYADKVSGEGWMIYVDPGPQAMVNVLWESDGTRMHFEAGEAQPDSVLVANNSRTLGSSYTFRVRPFLAVTDRPWQDAALYYKSRVEAVNPVWLAKKRPDRTDLGDAEKAVSPFVGIQCIDTTHAVGDGKPGDIEGAIETLRANCGAPAGQQINGSIESPPHNLYLPGEAANSDLREKLLNLYNGGNTFISMWGPGGPTDSGIGSIPIAGSPGVFSIARANKTLGSQNDLRWWTTSAGIGALRRSRKGYLEGGGVDRVAERQDGSYYRERTYTVTNWNAGTRTVSVTGGAPASDGFTGSRHAVLTPALGSSRMAFAVVSSLTASGVVISASAPTNGVFHNALGVIVSPQPNDTVTVFHESGQPGECCPHAMLNSTDWMNRYAYNTVLGMNVTGGICGSYLDTYSEPTMTDQREFAKLCYDDHSTWSKINPGYVRHPYGGGNYWKQSRRSYVLALRDSLHNFQIANGLEPYCLMGGEYLDEQMLGVIELRWHGVSDLRQFRDTTGFDPAIHKYHTVPAFSMVHAGRFQARGGLNEEFSNAIGSPNWNAFVAANFGAGEVDTLRRLLGWNLAVEWVYGSTLPVFSMFRTDVSATGVDVPLVNLWDDSIYVANGGAIHDDVRKERLLYEQITYAETRWITKWLRFGELMPLASLDMGVTTLTTGMAQTPLWTTWYQTGDTVYDRTAFPRVVHGAWKAADTSICVVFSNWSDTAGNWAGTLNLAAFGLPSAGTSEAARIIVRRRDYTGAVSGSATFDPTTGKLTVSSIPAYSIAMVTLTAAGSTVNRLFTVDTMPTGADGLRGVIFQSNTGENGELEYRRILDNDGQYVYLDAALTVRPSAATTWAIGSIASEWRSGLWDLGEPSEQKIVGYAELNVGPGGQGAVTGEIRFNGETVGAAENTYQVDATQDRVRIGPKVGRGVRIQARLYDDAAENYWEVTDIEIGFMPRRAVKWPS